MTQPRAVQSLFHVNINCSDLDASVAFYVRLGFTIQMATDRYTGESDESYRAMGVDGPIEHRGPVVLFLGDDPRQTRLDLMQWIAPSEERSTPVAIAPHRVGVPRIALWTKGIGELYDRLSAEGVVFITPPAGPFPDRAIQAIVALADPDGLIVELIEFLPRTRQLIADGAVRTSPAPA